MVVEGSLGRHGAIMEAASTDYDVYKGTSGYGSGYGGGYGSGGYGSGYGSGVEGSVGGREVVMEAANSDYVEYKGTSSYSLHGGVELDSDHTAPIGLTATACKVLCDADAACDCVTFWPHKGKCWRRNGCVPSQFDRIDGFDTYVKKAAKSDYAVYKGTSSYSGRGGVEIDSDHTAPIGLTLSACKERCDADSGCACVSFLPHKGKCWRRSACVPLEFDHIDGFDTYVKLAVSPSPAPAPPASWQMHANTNCFRHHGAHAVDSGDIGSLSLADCKAACQSKADCEGIVMKATCDASAAVKCWRYRKIDLAKCDRIGGYNLWLKTPSEPLPMPSPSGPRPRATCTPCPKLQTFDDPSHRQNCPNQERFQWIKDLIKKGCNQVWNLEAKTYYVDRQYLLPCGVTVKGAGKGKTIIKAVRCETPPDEYGIGTEGAKYRIGFVMNTNTMISDLSFVGDDSYRYFKQGASGKDYTSEGYGNGPGALCHAGGNGFTDLQGGAPFETPGCPDPYACGLTPCINGRFTTPVGYKWEPVGSIAVQNVVVRDVDATNVQNGFFGAPLFPEHLGANDDFDVEVHRPSNFRIVNFHAKMLHADGINFHGNFDDVLIDNYVVDEAYDDCVALWSYRDQLGNVTIQNSNSKRCGYQGCYVAYGGKGPFTWKNNKCSTATGNGKCLWLDGDMFNGQFNCGSEISSTGATCTKKSRHQKCVQSGTPRDLCPY